MSGWIGAKRGFVVACVNLALCALWITRGEHDHEAFALIVFYGFVPAVLTGLCVGATVGVMPSSPPILRLPVLVIPSFLVVTALGLAFSMEKYISGALIPTMLCCVWLERWTFCAAEKPSELPTARVA
ncbi:MAG TPA: hypothetical protein VGM39_13910 [Kofleriaceae bacterium]|jgi:hypothetical protein